MKLEKDCETKGCRVTGVLLCPGVTVVKKHGKR